MTGFIHQWKAFIEGLLTEKEAKEFLQTMDAKETQKALDNDLNRTWKDAPQDEYAKEIAGIIHNFKLALQKKTKSLKKNRIRKYKTLSLVMDWVACIGTLFFLVKQTDIAAYIDARPLDRSNAKEQIDNQYWVTSFLNGREAFANFRRTGYPELTPNPCPGSDIIGDFTRRLFYPDGDFSVNKENIQAALSRKGPDNLDTRVWWNSDSGNEIAMIN